MTKQLETLRQRGYHIPIEMAISSIPVELTIGYMPVEMAICSLTYINACLQSNGTVREFKGVCPDV